MTAPISFPLARERWRRERVALEERRRALLARTEEAVREVLGGEGVDAAYVVGSLVDPEMFGAASDVDIAVLGLPSERYFSALGHLMDRIGTEEVDLIELERVPFRAELERRGRRVL